MHKKDASVQVIKKVKYDKPRLKSAKKKKKSIEGKLKKSEEQPKLPQNIKKIQIKN
jgi:hypothetical protein